MAALQAFVNGVMASVPPPMPSPRGPPPPDGWLVDPDTPLDELRTTGLGDGLEYRMVMSDEFEQEGRRFDEKFHDPRWTAVSRHDHTNGNLAYMTPEAVTTRRGALEITTTNTGFRDGAYASGSVQGWNKFCMQGGIIDVSFTLPGAPGLSGVWPAIWMLGNLGRATYTLSTDGLWPWTYSSCQPEVARTLRQTVSACERGGVNEHARLAGLRPGQGRGVPEIDVLEARPCADLAALGGRLARQPAHARSTCALATMQVAPRLPLHRRPIATHFPDAERAWYRALRFGDASELNPSWCAWPCAHQSGRPRRHRAITSCSGST